MASDTILYELADGVATVTFNRPDKLNAWTAELGIEFQRRLLEADADPDVRVVVVTGAGRAFTAGADLALLQHYAAGNPYDLTDTRAVAADPDVRGDWRGAFSFMLGMAKPVVAAVNGAAAGIGFVVALFCDVRFAAESARFTTAFGRLGLPAEHGLSWLLPRVVGVGRAADLLLSSRLLGAQEAFEMGLVNKVVPDDELLPFVQAYAGAMATEMAPSSLFAMKRQLWGDLLDPLEVSWRAASDRLLAMLAAPDFAEGLAAFLEKRTADFPGVSHGPARGTSGRG